MTGAAQWPERGSPETRTAEQQQTRTPRQAIKSLHAAERQLLAAERGDAMARALAEIAMQSALRSASKRRTLSAHYAAKIAALAPSLSPSERAAAIERLREEENAATQALDIELQRTAAAERTQTTAHLRQHYRSRSAGLHQRQRRQRAALAMMFRRPSSTPRPAAQPRSAIRRVATRVHQRRAGGRNPRAPR